MERLFWRDTFWRDTFCVIHSAVENCSVNVSIEAGTVELEHTNGKAGANILTMGVNGTPRLTTLRQKNTGTTSAVSINTIHVDLSAFDKPLYTFAPLF